MERKLLPTERTSITHKFSSSGHEGYITVGKYEDGTLGEIFLTMAKEGSTLSGLMDCFAISVSMALQYGVPLEDLVNKFTHVRFEPSGFTGNKQIPMAKSIIDYIFRWLAVKFLDAEKQKLVGVVNMAIEAPKAEPAPVNVTVPCKSFVAQTDAPTCPDCGSIMNRNGSCYLCPSCGRTSGCS